MTGGPKNTDPGFDEPGSDALQTDWETIAHRREREQAAVLEEERLVAAALDDGDDV